MAHSFLQVYASERIAFKRFACARPKDLTLLIDTYNPEADAPTLDCAYKLQEYGGAPRRKRSSGKATWPGRKQVWRRYDDAGRMVEDTVTLQSEQLSGEPLLECVMTDGRRSHAAVPLAEIRQRAAADLMRLPMHLRAVDPAAAAYAAYPVCIPDSIIELAKESDRSLV